jgi:predicted DNA-binding transcriptional regulator AlpA
MNRVPSFLNRSELAFELSVSESTVDELVRRKVIPEPLRMTSGTVRWDWQEVRDALARLKPSSNHAPVDPFLAGVSNVPAAERRRGRSS